jgi:hypothetical protein
VSAVQMITDASAALSSLGEEEAQGDSSVAQHIASKLYINLCKIMGAKCMAGSEVPSPRHKYPDRNFALTDIY